MKKLIYLDCCYPDYFLGHSGPVLAVLVWPEMTKEELAEAVISAYEAEDDSFPELESLDRAIAELLAGAAEYPFPDAGEETYLYLGVSEN